jgi:hypothetical protein
MPQGCRWDGSFTLKSARQLWCDGSMAEDAYMELISKFGRHSGSELSRRGHY